MSGLRVQFGKTLKYFRMKNDLTQGRLADLTGLSIDFIGMIERGERSPSFESLELLANALNVSVASLFEEVVGEKNKSFRVRRIS